MLTLRHCREHSGITNTTTRMTFEFVVFEENLLKRIFSSICRRCPNMWWLQVLEYKMYIKYSESKFCQMIWDWEHFLQMLFVFVKLHCLFCEGNKQSPKNLGGRVALPSGKFLRVRKVFARNPWNCNWEFPDPLENFQIFSGLSGKFPDSLESFRIGWIFSGWSGKFPDSLESFWIGWIFSGWSGKFSG